MRLFKGTSFVAATLLAGLAVSLSVGVANSGDVDPVVWKGVEKLWLRDPAVFAAEGGTYILSGTNAGIIEYPDVAPGSFNAGNGKGYTIKFYSPNGERNLAKNGFSSWEKNFFQTAEGMIMIASIPVVENYDTDEKDTGLRSVYDFVPREKTRRTDGGFPLDWRLEDNSPLVKKTYNGDIYAADGKLYIYTDRRQDTGSKKDKKAGKVPPVTCVMVQELSQDMVAGEEKTVMLCPGRKEGGDKTGWDRANPMPSEVRQTGEGGLIEGAWGYDSPDGKHLLLYSAGAYKTADNYGGFVAVCDTPMGACRKIRTKDDSDVRAFVAPSSKNYTHVGRPFPVLDAEGTLADIVFHARRRGGENTDIDILRCMNFTPDILEKFVEGGPVCAFDDNKG